MHRAAVMGVVIAVVAATAGAQVHLVVRNDGTKVIYNVGGGPGRGSDFNWLAKQHDRRSKYDDLIEKYAAKYRIDPVLVRAVIQVESNFNPWCVSNKGARGLMQLMPGTARQYGVEEIHDPEQNIRAGIRHLATLVDLFPDDLSRALAAYNAGENAVLRYGGIPPYEETSTYVKRALTVYYGHPYGQATSFAARRGGKKLRGGFAAQPLALALLPGAKLLGTH